jgi:hypothetical protein
MGLFIFSGTYALYFKTARTAPLKEHFNISEPIVNSIMIELQPLEPNLGFASGVPCYIERRTFIFLHYIVIIDEAIGLRSKPSSGQPRSCPLLRDNFF